MNKLITHEGQMPLYLGDIDFMQNSVRESLRQLSSLLQRDNYPTLLKGYMALNNKTATISKCAIVLNGEILPVEDAVFPLGENEKVFIEIVKSYDESRVFKNGDEHKCQERRIAKVVKSKDKDKEVFGEFSFPFNRIENVLADKIQPKLGIQEHYISSDVKEEIARVSTGILNIKTQFILETHNMVDFRCQIEVKAALREQTNLSFICTPNGEAYGHLGSNFEDMANGDGIERFPISATLVTGDTMQIIPGIIQFLNCEAAFRRQFVANSQEYEAGHLEWDINDGEVEVILGITDILLTTGSKIYIQKLMHVRGDMSEDLATVYEKCPGGIKDTSYDKRKDINIF